MDRPEGKKERRWYRIRRMRSRARALFIVVGFLFHWANPITLAVGGGILFLARTLQVWAYGHLDKASRTTRNLPGSVTTSGPYAFVRNPIMYGSAFSDIGFLTMTGNPILIGLYVIIMAPVHVSRILRLEEPFLRKEYGEGYDRYAASVPRLLPRLTPMPERQRKPFRFELVLLNRELSRTFNYLFLGSALALWSDLGAARLIPSWDQLRHAVSVPWVLAGVALLGALAILASLLQRRVARQERERERAGEVGTREITPGSPSSGPPTPP